MLDSILPYLDSAPIAVIILLYFYFSDKQKQKIIKGMLEQMERLQAQNDRLIEKLG